MLEILHAGCLGLSQAISAQFIFEKRAAARSRKNLLKSLILKI